MRIKQSIAFPIFGTDELPLGELCRNAAEIGYAAIEMWGRRGGGAAGDDDFDEVVATAREHGLRMVSTCGHGTLENGGNNPANHDRIVSELQETIDLAAASDVPNVIAFAGNGGNNPANHDRIVSELQETIDLAAASDVPNVAFAGNRWTARALEGMVECARVLRRVAPIAEDAGVNVNVELLNSRVDHPGYLGDHTDWGIALCEMVGSPRVKVLFDIYHMQIMEGDVIRSIRRALPHIGHFHTAGNPGRQDLDDTQELNYRGICHAIAATDYDGYVGHEFVPASDILPALRHAFDVCNAGGPPRT